MSRVQIRIGAKGVSRRFGPVVANDGVDLAIAPGTVHAVIGENGAGKTTLMRILYGLDRPDAGSVIIDDEPVGLSSPREALDRGIGMVHQELSLIPELTMLENLVLGDEPRRGPFIDWALARDRVRVLGERTGVDLDWDLPVARAPVGARQRGEILRLLYRGADVLILDEPTAVLAPAQVRELFGLLRGLVEQGSTVVFISHKLDEVLSIADHVTVLREGRSVAERPTAGVTAGELAELVVGGELPPAATSTPASPGAAVLEVRGIRAGDDRGIERLDGTDLTVRAGEIVGVAGVAGNGQEELVECVAGLRRVSVGAVVVGGTDVTGAPVARRRELGLAYISPDRANEGLAVAASLAANVVAGSHRQAPIGKRGWMRPKATSTHVATLLERFGVRYGSPTDPAVSLSGGNQQRAVIAREVDRAPILLVAAQPTRGIDVKGISFVHDQLLSLRDAGTGILLVSEELDELLTVSDRIVVLYRGRVAGELGRDQFDRARLGRLMTGEAAA